MPSLPKHPIAWLLLLCALTFGRSLTYDFMHLDDPSHLDYNPLFTPLTLTNTSKAWWTEPHGIYMPVTYTVWAVQALVTERPSQERNLRAISGVPKLYRFQPFLFHLVNLTLHLLSVGLLFQIALLAGVTPIAAAAGSVLFALHPLQVEVVAWISALKDTLSTAFALASLYFVLKQEDEKHNRLGFLFFTLALLSKPTVAVLPLGMVLWLWAGGNSLSSSIKRLAPFFGIAFVLAISAAANQPISATQFTPPPVVQRPLVALDALAFYLQKLFWPQPLFVDYGYSPQARLAADGIWVQAAIGLAAWLIAIGLTLKKQTRWVGAGILFFLISLLPTSGLKPFFHQTISTVTDRYVYFGLIGLSLAAARGLCVWERRKPQALLFTGAGFALLFAWLSFHQLSFWKNGETLLTHTLQHNQNSWLAYNNLGAYHEREDRLDAAFQNYSQSARIKPTPSIFNNMGAVALAANQNEKAERVFREGLGVDPDALPNQHGLALALVAQGKKAAAERILKDALRKNPQFTQASDLLRKIASSTDK